eukprot:7328476-Pyramimonas_sp.AAC.1
MQAARPRGGSGKGRPPEGSDVPRPSEESSEPSPKARQNTSHRTSERPRSPAACWAGLLLLSSPPRSPP